MCVCPWVVCIWEQCYVIIWLELLDLLAFTCDGMVVDESWKLNTSFLSYQHEMNCNCIRENCLQTCHDILHKLVISCGWIEEGYWFLQIVPCNRLQYLHMQVGAVLIVAWFEGIISLPVCPSKKRETIPEIQPQVSRFDCHIPRIHCCLYYTYCIGVQLWTNFMCKEYSWVGVW